VVDYEKIGQRIYENRKSLRKISQEKMAEDLGMYQADISNLEKAKNGSGIQDLAKLDLIAEYFNIPLEYLLFGITKEDKLIEYYGSKMNIIENKGNGVLLDKHIKTLEMLTGANPTKIDVTSYSCGPYTIYKFIENLTQIGDGNTIEERIENGFVLQKLHLYTFFESEVIASMVVPFCSVMDMVYQPTAATIQEMICPDVLDVFDCIRTLNPYIPFMYFPIDEKEEIENQKKVYKRMDELRECADSPVLFIESAYVSEECRKKGMLRLLMDVLKLVFGDYTAWLNLEPSGDNLDTEYDVFPVMTKGEVGQMSINAAIAEKLGYTVDPDTWHRTVDIINSEGGVESEVVLVRKCAYKIADCIKPILANDDDLVEQGRARQKIKSSEAC